MKMDKTSAVTSAVSYGSSLGGAAYWFNEFLNSHTPDQWAAIGVLGTLLFAFITCLFNIIFKVWDRKNNMVRRDED